MSVVAILGVTVDKNTNRRLFNIGVTEDYKTATCRTMNEHALVAEVVRGKHRLVNAKIGNKRIEEALGSFKRFEGKGEFKPVVLMAVCENEAGRTLGFVVISQSGIISRVKKDDLYESCKLAKSNEVAFIQNAIYRETNGVPQIAGYEDGCFPVIKLASNTKRPARDTAVRPTATAEKVTEVTKKPISSERVVVQHNTVQHNPAKTTPLSMSPAQNKELEAAKKAGVNPMLIDSPKLSPEKQRVIWAAKKNGISAEYFTNPKFEKDQMVFFADRLENDDRFKECMSFVDPKFSVDQMKQLYLGVCSGVDISQYLDEDLTPEEMYIRRIELENELYDRAAIICSTPDEACIRNFMRRRGLVDESELMEDEVPEVKAHNTK